MRLEWPQESTNRSRPGQCGSAGLCRITFWNSRYAAGRQAHRRAGVAVADLLHGVHRQHPDGVHRLVVELGPVQSGGDGAHGGPLASIQLRRRGTAEPTHAHGVRLRGAFRYIRYPLRPRGTHRDLRRPVGLGCRGLDGTAAHAGARQRARTSSTAYVGLTKPRVIELLLLTTVPVMFFAARGVPALGLVVATVVGGALSAGSASALNCVYDRDIDEQMRRTRRRALPRHIVSPRARRCLRRRARDRWRRSSCWRCGSTRSRPGSRSPAEAFYVFVYTMLLKRRTTQNIVWGGLAGCFPALIGWTAVTGELAWPPVVLFLVVFFWTPPHTWALALRYREDYANVDVPMLPVVAPAAGSAGRSCSTAGRWSPRRCCCGRSPDTGLVYPSPPPCSARSSSSRRTGCGAAPRATEDLARDRPDAALPLLQPLPLAALRRRRARPAADPLNCCSQMWHRPVVGRRLSR